MKKMRLGNTDEFLPVIGIGTWGMGGKFEADRSRDQDFVNSLIRAVDLGMTHIDTAEFYGAGHTEEIVGKALKEIGRERVFITSKIWPDHLKLKNAVKSIETTLKKLGTDHVDLYLVHWPSSVITVEETVETMNKLLEKGYTRYIGVSNFSKAQLEEAIKFSEAPIVCDQVRFNIQDRSAEENGLLDFCRKHAVTLTAYSPLNRMEFDFAVKKKLEEIARRRNAIWTQIALAWVVKKGALAIPKATSEKHLKENARAGDLDLSNEDMKYLESTH